MPIFRLNGKTTGKLFSFEQLLRAKDTGDFKLQHKPVDTTHPVDVQKMLNPEMYLLMQQYLYGITEAVVQRCSVERGVL